MSKTITKENFIKQASNLDNFYKGSDIALYSYARDCKCINKTFNFMTGKNRTVGEVTEFIYDCDGRPNPKLVIVDTEEERDRLIEQEKKKLCEKAN